MTIEYTDQGYWLAQGRFMGRTILAEGSSRGEAFSAWVLTAIKRRLA